MEVKINYRFLVCLLLVTLFCEEVLSSHRFGYSESNQRRWGKRHGHCGGKNQSPIGIQSGKALPIFMPAIEMIGYRNLLPFPLKLMNNGHTVSLHIPRLPDSQTEIGEFLPYVKGGKLPGEYEVEGVHFHWGDRNNRGAEHVINDIRYTMEMHIVHRNKKYNSLPEALDYADGVAVLGFFFALDEDEGDELTTIVKHLHLIPNSGESISLNVTFSLSSLLNNIDLDKFYTYKGSLTTPPCSEAVTWVLFPDPLPISPNQISRFRHLQDTLEDALVDNFRSLQPIGNRRIFVQKVNSHHTTKTLLATSSVHHTDWDWFNEDL